MSDSTSPPSILIHHEPEQGSVRSADHPLSHVRRHIAPSLRDTVAPGTWDASDANSMHAISLSEVPDEWQPKMLHNEMAKGYKDIAILIGAIFAAGLISVWLLVMAKCLYNHECFWQSDGCLGERQKRRRERKLQQQRKLMKDRNPYYSYTVETV